MICRQCVRICICICTYALCTCDICMCTYALCTCDVCMYSLCTFDHDDLWYSTSVEYEETKRMRTAMLTN